MMAVKGRWQIKGRIHLDVQAHVIRLSECRLRCARRRRRRCRCLRSSSASGSGKRKRVSDLFLCPHLSTPLPLPFRAELQKLHTRHAVQSVVQDSLNSLNTFAHSLLILNSMLLT